jgi:hypothetical protein
MKPARRVVSLLGLFGLLFALMALPAFATDETEPSEGSTGQIEPAVQVSTPDEAPPELDWTYRYMIPTAIALGVIVIVITSGQYFTQVVRKRYRILEE